MAKINLSNINLIILDFDGPINDLTQSKVWAIKSSCKSLGIKLSQDILLNAINYIDQVYESKKVIDYKEILELVIEKLKNQGLLNIDNKKRDYFIRKFLFYLTKKQALNQNLIKIIKKFKQKQEKIRICVYSSQSEVYIKKFFRQFKINLELFDKIFSTENFSEPKPSMKNLEAICKDFKTVPRRTVIIGDNVAVDLTPAKFLGMKTVLCSKSVDRCIKPNQDFWQIFTKI